jgi:hypothetical protein
MLNRFNSNARKLNRAMKQININNLNGGGYIDNLFDDYKQQLSLSGSYDGRDENGNPLPEEQAKAEFSASLQYVYVPTIDTSIPNKFNSNTKSNPNPIKLVNNKNKIEAFHNEILQFSGRMISKGIDTFDNTGFGTLTIYSASLDYGTEGASAENFEVLVYGLHLPGHYTIKEQNGNVVITLLDNYIDYDSVTINDIYVIGKFK